MVRRRKLIVISLVIFGVFLLLTAHFMNTLSQLKRSEVRSAPSVEEKINKFLRGLPPKYKSRRTQSDNISDIFVSNLQQVRVAIENLQDVWAEANSWVSKTQLYDLGNRNLGRVLYALKNARVIKADLDGRGTQLKFLLTLQGNQQVVFKPKWYEPDVIIEGPVYGGKDRYGSEILAFYLSGLLNKPLVPVAVERTLSIRNDLLPVASAAFLETAFERNHSTCVFGKCYYCARADPICDDSGGELTGAVMLNVRAKFKSHRSPWQRTYKRGKEAVWETNEEYCKTLSNKLPRNRIFDLVDVAVFDFLIQNGDRHHYEVNDNNLVWIDNGKGLGNPNVHYTDILAPLYQCCVIRQATWQRLQQLSGGLLKEKLQLMPDIKNFVKDTHLDAIEHRLLLIYATVEYCRNRNKLVNIGP